MPVIEYAWLWDEDEDEELCILRPVKPSISGQYVVMIYRETRTHAIHVTGHEQFKALELCMTEAGLHMSGRFSRLIESADGPVPRRASVAAPKTRINQRFVEEPVTVAIATHQDRNPDETYDLAVFVPNGIAGADKKPGLLEGTSALIQMSEASLKSLGNIFWRMSSAEFRPAFVSEVEEWFLPSALSRPGLPEELMRAQLLQQAVAHVRAQCPEFADAWIEYLEQLEIPTTVQCASCLNFFAGNNKVRKQRHQCAGCASGHGSSAYTEQQLDEVKTLAPWLSAT